MLRPGLVFALTDSICNRNEYQPFCQNLNGIIRTLAVKCGNVQDGGRAAETAFVYDDNVIRCTYQSNAYGNDKYHLEVSNDYWSRIPPGVPRALVLEDGWNLVYSFQDSPGRQIILQHIPGEWTDLLERYE